ncbi:hypothetical protein GA0074692_5250 [Micromonospora pallida]|uniref:Peptidase inhibitor family I36 n=1 Tax=Micromonospora pallida TaxID=145854 RepID=A0A1C6TCC3_9ACTN|nr:hypothetical protein GA0074692_5250 [Micromonospora pallida]
MGRKRLSGRFGAALLGLVVAVMASIFGASPAQATLPPGAAVAIDPKTGEIVAVYEEGMVRPLITQTSSCVNSSYACYYSGQVPYADQGFYGTAGTKTGSWPSRSGGRAGNYSVSFCWSAGGTVCGPTLGPGLFFFFSDGNNYTGLSFRIH